MKWSGGPGIPRVTDTMPISADMTLRSNCGNCQHWLRRIGAFGLCEHPHHMPKPMTSAGYEDPETGLTMRTQVVTSDLMACSKHELR